MDETTRDYETAVSQTATRHVLAKASVPYHAARGRQTALCGFGVLGDPDEVETVRDCEFCQVELAKIRQRAEDARMTL